jgi:hypothetical protein
MGLQFFRYFVSFSGFGSSVLINDKGDTITDFKEVLAEERSFYKSLYSKNHAVYDNINEINNFFFPDDPEIPKT